ncbi:DUF6115 domain-containing protein [Peribacillus sp. SCS-37]|uniref:DUF6115 domain-containing protein n=1 Tax=Paraperibacillus esterisolvens TaxID=3115296 RepID=UPI003906B903
MTIFLLFFSFLLNIIAIFGIIILYSRQNSMLAGGKKQEEAVKELETILSSFVLELKEDNEQFLRDLEKAQTGKSSPVVKRKGKTAPVKPSGPAKAEGHRQPPSIYSGHESAEDGGYADSLIESGPRDVLELTNSSSVSKKTSFKTELEDQLAQKDQLQAGVLNPLAQQVLKMKESGLRVDEIAKKLNKGKTEIELLIKFHE